MCRRAVISIQKFLNQKGEARSEAEETLMHVIRNLVQGIGEYSGKGDSHDCREFREHIRKVSDVLSEPISAPDLLMQAGFVLKTLDDHIGRSTRSENLRKLELQGMVSMLAKTVSIVSAASHTNIKRLEEIEKQVSRAAELSDVRMIKKKLSECLADIRRECERQINDTQATIEEISKRPSPDGSLNGNDGARADSVTGLPLRPQAEAALTELARANSKAYAAVLVLDRLSSLNARFGREAGDTILAAFARAVKSQLTSDDQLFRWDGPVLLALMPRPSGLELVRSELSRMMETRMEHTIETPSRSIMIPVTPRWALIPMMAAPRLMYQKIDTFAALPASRN